MAYKQPVGDTLQELKAELKDKQPRRFYIFHGEEVFLLHHYLLRLKKLLVDEITESFNYHKLNKETFDVRSFADAVESLPMMADNTFVWVDDIDIFKLPEGDREKLGEVFADIPSYCTVVFTFETVQWKPDKRMKKFWEAIEKNASIVEFPKQGRTELIAWVSRHFAANQKKITPDLCGYLIDITGGTMTNLIGEISKVCAYSASEQIVKSDIDAVTEPVLDAAVFDMTNLLGEGNYGQALVKLEQLMKMQQEPIAILGAIGNHFRRLGVAKTLLDNGKNAGDFMQLYKMGDYQARKLMGATKKFSGSFFKTATELLMEADHNLKTSYDTPERILEVLILQLSQEARNG